MTTSSKCKRCFGCGELAEDRGGFPFPNLPGFFAGISTPVKTYPCPHCDGSGNTSVTPGPDTTEAPASELPT